jgi:hypothetical protein
VLKPIDEALSLRRRDLSREHNRLRTERLGERLHRVVEA